jgi:ADP-ribose pyrophosphatase YjhB (NUDIX family)
MPYKIDSLGLIYVENKKLLVALSKGKKAWYLPGGKREQGESDIEALSREVQEEMSVKLVPESVRYYGVVEAQAHGYQEGTIVRMTCYTANITGELKPGREIAELRFISASEKHMAAPAVQTILQELRIKGFID